MARSSALAEMSRKTISSAPSRLVALGELHRVADVAQLHELHPLHHAAALHVEADDQPARQHASRSLGRRRRSSTTAPFVLNTAPPSTQRVAQREAERLERRLDDVVPVVAAQHAQVQRAAALSANDRIQ